MKSRAKTPVEGVWFGWPAPSKLGLADLAAMLWTERLSVLAVGSAICALGLVAAFAAPQAGASRTELLGVTLLVAAIVSTAAGLSRALTRRGLLDAGARPALTVIKGGA